MTRTKPAFTQQSKVHWRARTQTTVRPQRLTSPPCSYTHAVFLTGFWLTFLTSVIGNIGYSYGEVDGIHAKDLSTFQPREYYVVPKLWIAAMVTFSPRFPDVWIAVPSLLRVPKNFEGHYHDNLPRKLVVGAIAFGSVALIAIRLKLIFTCLRNIRKHR
jgi:hypothetical protein